MKRSELHIEHKYKNRFIGHHRLTPGKRLTTLGHSREANIRLLGDNVSDLHASIECQNNGWVISDLGGEHGTWINKKTIVHHEITEPIEVMIGQHHMRLTPVERHFEMFNNEHEFKSSAGAPIFHQVVVRRNGLLIENKLLPASQKFVFIMCQPQRELLPPQGQKWVTTKIDDYEVRQRMIRVDLVSSMPNGQGLKQQAQLPFLIAGACLLVFMTVLVLLPQKPKDEMAILKPEELNQYTRMIYDAAKIKKQKAEAMQLRKKIAGQEKEVEKPRESAPGTGGSAAKVVNNIKASGLKALIGKISARAAKNVNFVQTQGVAPDVAGSGVALGAGRSIASTAPNQTGLAAGKGHQISGVGTAGKAGGGGDYKGFGGLAVGNVGNASVGLLEDESEVEGGLDKDVIARYIKSQLGQIRYCYERQLSASPDLYGKILVKFTIGATGSVVTQNIGTSSLNNAMVEGCILRRIAGWQFPTPKGGTNVIVSYPFLFKSTR